MPRRALQTLCYRPHAWVALTLIWGAGLQVGCSPTFGGQTRPGSALLGDSGDDDAADTPEPSGPAAQATPTETTSPEDRAEAARAFGRGLMAYHRGDYSKAETALKEALVLDPFLGPAHLTLGKIYLLRGIAADDHKRLQKARRMVEMAVRLDPKSTEAQTFLLLLP